MKKLIEICQEYLIECDHCDYKIINESKDPNTSIKEYINMPCPICGSNLLTEKDYHDNLTLLSVINWMNKWLGWIAYFIPNKYVKNVSIKVKDGINLEDDGLVAEVTKVRSNPRYEYEQYLIFVDYACMGLNSSKYLYFDTKEDALNLCVGFKFKI